MGLPKRPSTRRNAILLLALLVISAIVAVGVWLNGSGTSTPAASPTSDVSAEETQKQEPEQSAPAQTPSPTEGTTPKPLPISGAVKGNCLPSGNRGIVCTLEQAPSFSNDGYAQYPGGGASEFLLIKCSGQSCQASSAPKNQIPCVQGDGQKVFCANVTDRERVYRAVDAMVYYCNAHGSGFLCSKGSGYTVVDGSLAISTTSGTMPVELARTKVGRLSAYAVQAPAGFAAFGNCSQEDGGVMCRPSDASGIVPAGLLCTPEQDKPLTCTPPIGSAPQTVTVWCPGSDAPGTYCPTRKGGMNIYQWDCIRDAVNERKLTCRYVEAA